MACHQKTEKSKPGLALYLNLGLALVLTVVGLSLLSVIKTAERRQALVEAEHKAQLILDRTMAIHTYFTHTLRPKVFELTNPVRDENYFEPAWMSSTYAVREIDNFVKSMNHEEYYYKECAINARSPENEADEFERSFIRELNADPELEYRSQVRNIDGIFYYVTLRRGETMEQVCLRCHSTPDQAPQALVDTYGADRSFHRQADEVVSAISIRVPLSTAYANADKLSRKLSQIFILALLLIFTVQYLVHRFIIIRPITRLKDRALAISRDETLLGEEITLPISREFAHLAAAFNTMSGRLAFQMTHLEEMVEKRTTELTRANDKLQQALDQIKTLQGVIPICMHCKGIRDDKGYWNQLEKYITDHADVKFSHGICDKCLAEHYPDDLE